MGTSERQKKPSMTLSFNRLLPAFVCHGRGRGFEPRRPRHKHPRFMAVISPFKPSAPSADLIGRTDHSTLSASLGKLCFSAEGGSMRLNDAGIFQGFAAPLGFNFFLTIKDAGEREKNT
jgi:hypothetical protein